MTNNFQDTADIPGFLHGEPVEEETVYVPATPTSLWVTNLPPIPVKLPLVVTTTTLPLGGYLALAMPLGFLVGAFFLRWTTSLPMQDVLGFSVVTAGIAAGAVFLSGLSELDDRRACKLVISRDGFFHLRTMTRPVAWSDVLKIRVSSSKHQIEGIKFTLRDISAIRRTSIFERWLRENQIFIRLNGSNEERSRIIAVIGHKLKAAGVGRGSGANTTHPVS